jgi:chitin disaccharide deacetylase
MKQNLILIIALILIGSSMVQAQDIRLLIRGDDIGSSHAANVGCIESYQKGIVRSVELMVPCAWYPEAVKLLNENPGLDVGVHLTLTSEWSNVKWRPLTQVPSLVDSSGFFFPMVWQREDFPPNTSIQKSEWKIEEIEKELRAQIEMAMRDVPHVSHMGGHMGFAGLDPEIEKLVNRLRKEYGLEAGASRGSTQRFPGWGDAKTLQERIDNFAENLENLEPGTYLFIDHPAKDTPEMQAVRHKGYDHVAQDRDWVTRVFTSEKVRKVIKKKNIQLISYKDI